MDTSNSTKKVPQDCSLGIKDLSLCNRIFHMFDDKTRIACLSDLVFFFIWDMEPYCRGWLSGLKSAIMASLQAIQNRLAKIPEAHNLQRINPFFQLIVMLQLNRKIYLDDINVVFRILNDWGLLYESRSKKKGTYIKTLTLWDQLRGLKRILHQKYLLAWIPCQILNGGKGGSYFLNNERKINSLSKDQVLTA